MTTRPVNGTTARQLRDAWATVSFLRDEPVHRFYPFEFAASVYLALRSSSQGCTRRELCRRFSVSAAVINEALELLTAVGWIEASRTRAVKRPVTVWRVQVSEQSLGVRGS